MLNRSLGQRDSNGRALKEHKQIPPVIYMKTKYCYSPETIVFIPETKEYNLKEEYAILSSYVTLLKPG